MVHHITHQPAAATASAAAAAASTRGVDSYRRIFQQPTQHHHQQQHHQHNSGDARVLPYLIAPNSTIARAVMGNATSSVDRGSSSNSNSRQRETVSNHCEHHPQQHTSHLPGERTSNMGSNTTCMVHSPHTQQQQQHDCHQRPQQHQHNHGAAAKSNLSVLLEDKDASMSDERLPAAAIGEVGHNEVAPSSPCAACCENPQNPAATETAENVLSTSVSSNHNEADSASGPPPPPVLLGHSAPAVFSTFPPSRRRYPGLLAIGTPPGGLYNLNDGMNIEAICTCATPSMSLPTHQRRGSSSDIKKQSMLPMESNGRVRRYVPFFCVSFRVFLGCPLSLLIWAHPPTNPFSSLPTSCRCLSSKELGTLAPPSGSPYADMLTQKEELESTMTERLRVKRDSIALQGTPSNSPPNPASVLNSILPSDRDLSTTSSTSSSQKSSSTARRSKKSGANEDRNRRRAAHNRAVVEDLCDVVTDLFVAESKLLNPLNYGVCRSSSTTSSTTSRSPHLTCERDQVLKSVQKFVGSLPTRYALGADTPSEVLLHMRLMAVARSDPTKCVVHIINLENDSCWMAANNIQGHGKSSRQRNLRLVTIACSDAVGLLEYMTKLLGTGGSRGTQHCFHVPCTFLFWNVHVSHTSLSVFFSSAGCRCHAQFGSHCPGPLRCGDERKTPPG